MFQKIPFASVPGVSVGNVEDSVGKTGVTVFRFLKPALGGVFVSGGGPASRETPVLDAERAETPVNALVLGGGSAYGLAAADGVMRSLEQRKIGYDTGFALVPIVVQSCIYDLSYGNPKVRPGVQMGFDACEASFVENRPESGNVGAGTGATVGKICGMKRGQKSGIGYSALQVGDAGSLKVGAAVVVNALGDIFDGSANKIAGLTNAERTAFADSEEELYKLFAPTDFFTHGHNVPEGASGAVQRGNTTIGAIFVNAPFSKAELKKIAQMATNAYARCINPVGTMADGDTIYAFSVSEESLPPSSMQNAATAKPDINMVGTLAARAMMLAIQNAIESSKIPDSEYLKNC